MTGTLAKFVLKKIRLVKQPILKIAGFAFVLAVISLPSIAQDTVHTQQPSVPSKQNIFSVGLGAQYGFVFAHSEAVRNTKGSHPYGGELLLSWQRNDQKTWDLCNCYPRKGLLLGYYDYDNAILGKGIVSAYFLEPTYRLNRNIFFSFRGAAGLAWLTNPYDSQHNSENMSYSTVVNMYTTVGLGLWWRLNEKWRINTSVNYQHISNGGMKQPNKGLNYPTAGLAINYIPQPMPYFSGQRSQEKYWQHQRGRWDFGLFGTAKRIQNDSGQSIRVPIIGIQTQVAKQVGRINALTAGIEVSGDRSVDIQLEKDSIKASAIRAAVLGGHEFLLGKFIFSQRIGVYFFDQTPYFDAWFHCWGINYRINKSLGVGLNLKAHKQVAEYFDFRFVYSFRGFEKQ